MNEELMQSRRAECLDIVAQTRDAEALRDAGIITEPEYARRKGLNTACLRVLSLLDAGSYVDDEQMKQIVSEEVASVSPTAQGRISDVEESVRVAEAAIVELAEIVAGGE